MSNFARIYAAIDSVRYQRIIARPDRRRFRRDGRAGGLCQLSGLKGNGGFCDRKRLPVL